LGACRLYLKYNIPIIFLNIDINNGLANDDEYRRAVFLHEFGHILKLAHPFQTTDLASVENGRGGYQNEEDIVSIMTYGDLNLFNNTFCRIPKIHDRINLKNKWE